MPRSLTGSSAGATEEGFKDVSKAAKTKVFKAPAKYIVSTSVSEAVIGSAFIGVREHLIGFIDFLEPGFSAVIAIPVRMVLKGKLTKSFLYFLIRGAPGHPQNLVIIPFLSHIIVSILLPYHLPVYLLAETKLLVYDTNGVK